MLSFAFSLVHVNILYWSTIFTSLKTSVAIGEFVGSCSWLANVTTQFVNAVATCVDPVAMFTM